MKKIIIGCLLIKLLIIEPIIGYTIFKTWLNIDNVALNFSAVIFAFAAFFQLLTYGGLVVSGFKDMKIKHPFSN